MITRDNFFEENQFKKSFFILIYNFLLKKSRLKSSQLITLHLTL